MDEDKDLLTSYLKSIVEPIVDNPEAVEVTKSHDELGVLLSVKVHKNDMGQVVGKAGETAKALRHLVRIMGAKQKARVSIKILEPEGSTHRQYDDQSGF